MKNLLSLIGVLTQKEFKVRYKGSFLGYLWAIVHPLMFAFVFYIAFKVVMKVQIENYTVFLISALFAWQWFSGSVLLSSTSYLANAQIVKKTSFPRFVLPLSNILMESIHFLITIPVIILFLYIYNITPNYLAILLYTPVIMLFQIGFTFGLGLVFSSLNVFFRDIERLLSIVMLLWFYVTPIIYSIDLIPKEIVSYMRLNPILPFIESWRELFLNGEISTQYLIPMLINSAISLVLGSLFYFKLKDKFSEVL
ncbi:TPA: ABC transporter permease [Photobacterium damselae]